MDRVSRRYRDIEIVDNEQFDYTGYQIVRGEFFAHTFEPAIVFNKGKVSVNSACLRKLPETEKAAAELPSEDGELLTPMPSYTVPSFITTLNVT